MIEKPVSLLEDNILQLEDDIFDEIGVPTTKVSSLSFSLVWPIPIFLYSCLIVCFHFPNRWKFYL